MDVKRILKTSSRTKVGEYIPSGFSMSTISSFKTKENKHDVYRGKDCMKTFCEFLREHTMEIINVKKKKNEVINKQTNKQQKSYEKAKICYICKERFKDKRAKNKNYRKVRDHCHYTRKYRGAAYNICYLTN